LDGIAHVVGLPLGDVLEHVARGELELAFLRRRVVAALADELVELVHVLARLREADRGIDHAAGARRFVRGRRRHDSLKTRSAFWGRNFGQTLSRNGTSGISWKIRSSERPIG